jgi:hypothetical protein
MMGIGAGRGSDPLRLLRADLREVVPMRARRFRNFSDLSFLQQVDKPRFLSPLLRPYAEYLRSRGLDVAKLKNCDEHDRQLLTIFGSADDGMPEALLEVLHRLDDLSDEAGHDRILAEVERHEIPLRWILGQELSPGEFAIAMHCRYPQLVRDVHGRTTYPRVAFYEEYQARTDHPITLSDATAKLSDLERLLGSWFGARNRTEACKIDVHPEHEALRFEITHGRPYRMIGTISTRLERSRIGYRPQQHDSVIFDTRDCLLQVSASTETERDLYRQAFGMAFFEDDDHFPVGDVYNLEPLRIRRLTLATVAGLESVRLTALRTRSDDAFGMVQSSQGHDLLAPGGPCDEARRARGTIIGASFLLTYESGGPPRKLEIRPPNVALYDRARDGAVTEAFMLANQFLVRRPR